MWRIKRLVGRSDDLDELTLGAIIVSKNQIPKRGLQYLLASILIDPGHCDVIRLTHVHEE